MSVVPRLGGPAPTPDPRLWADPTRRKVLAALARHEEPVPLSVLAEEVGGHPNATRAHLEALRLAGLVVRESHSSGGRGRPSWLHSLTEVGRSAARRMDDDGAPDRTIALEHLSLAFVKHLAGTPGLGDLARQVGRNWGASIGSPTRARTRVGRRRAVMALFDRMGFTPVLEDPAPRAGVEGAGSMGGAGGASGQASPEDVIVLHSCPLLDSAREHPEVVCDVHQGLVVGLLEQAGAGPDVVRTDLDPFSLPQGCRLQLTWQGEQSGEAAPSP
ncbi:helix-turn-helix transcriptional regulator [Ornithinimicrobium panacihumi]|uniref:helix-turn-helix transcriptional regulator n=1 Tax=Ornithinimicrobium panacihumi TaxID=2008449 RepID=UPI003F887928